MLEGWRGVPVQDLPLLTQYLERGWGQPGCGESPAAGEGHGQGVLQDVTGKSMNVILNVLSNSELLFMADYRCMGRIRPI